MSGLVLSGKLEVLLQQRTPSSSDDGGSRRSSDSSFAGSRRSSSDSTSTGLGSAGPGSFSSGASSSCSRKHALSSDAAADRQQAPTKADLLPVIGLPNPGDVALTLCKRLATLKQLMVAVVAETMESECAGTGRGMGLWVLSAMLGWCCLFRTAAIEKVNRSMCWQLTEQRLCWSDSDCCTTNC